MSELPTPPDDMERLVGLAGSFAEDERFDEAAELYLLALRLDPQNVGVRSGSRVVVTLGVSGPAPPPSP